MRYRSVILKKKLWALTSIRVKTQIKVDVGIPWYNLMRYKRFTVWWKSANIDKTKVQSLYQEHLLGHRPMCTNGHLNTANNQWDSISEWTKISSRCISKDQGTHWKHQQPSLKNNLGWSIATWPKTHNGTHRSSPCKTVTLFYLSNQLKRKDSIMQISYSGQTKSLIEYFKA